MHARMGRAIRETAAGQQLVGLVTEKLACGSRQKSRLLPAAKKLLSEKSASATFFQLS